MSRQVARKAQGSTGSHLSASCFLYSHSPRRTGGQWALKNMSNLQLCEKTAMKQEQTTTSRSVALSPQEQSCPPRLWLGYYLSVFTTAHVILISAHMFHQVPSSTHCPLSAHTTPLFRGKDTQNMCTVSAERAAALLSFHFTMKAE